MDVLEFNMRPSLGCCLHIILFIACFSFTYLAKLPSSPSSPPRRLPASSLPPRPSRYYKRPHTSTAQHSTSKWSHYWQAPQLRQFSRINYYVALLAEDLEQRWVSALAPASMGLDVTEISESAALRPIQTAVSGARATAAPGADDDAPAADNGCVTPKASGARSAAAGGGDDDDAAASTGCVTPKASDSMAMLPIAPLREDDVGVATATGGEIGPRDGCAAAGDESSFTTPTAADSALVQATVCPPAPRKTAAALTRKRAPLQQRLFYPVPRDLTTVFVAVPQCPPPAKKMRAHVVESSVRLGT
ncbi:uncharacterized protein [Aegilops tauschii subsp. strangulata]|uniref:Uncharacterized protein n=1 Tax=Aegilops tauschii subsp. strangulata TaxID=200361 RepID=A0A453T261_AEGTS|nr:uncharacterized protein LOC109780337 [Aegilops tauschii subsp. strangulata]XP_044444246.1 uncharacterized protein LOC123170448 [Triticum aestivum]